MIRPLHALGWTVWLGGLSVYAFAASNPWHLGLALAATLLVALASPADPSPAGRAVRTFVVVGLVLLAFRLVFVGLLPNPGRTVVAVLPQLSVLGLTIGGPLTAEVLAQGGAEGLRLIVVLAAFGVFNARVDLSAVVRAVPPALRELGLVVGIAAAFVPGLLATARDVRDAQRMRGERGLRTLAPSLAVPLLARTLDRSFLLAESMDARGYGASAGRRPDPRVPAACSLAVVAGVAMWTAGWRTAAACLVVVALAGFVGFLRAATRGSSVTRLSARPPGWTDALVAAAAVAAAASAWVVEASWTAYPVLQAPTLWVPAAAAALLFAAPAAVEVMRR